MTATAATAPARPREMAPARGAGLPPIEEHARALGFEGLLNYRLWCHRSGFGSGLEKDRLEREREREAARLRPRAPHQTERRRQILEQLAAAGLDGGGARRQLGTPVSAGDIDLDAGTPAGPCGPYCSSTTATPTCSTGAGSAARGVTRAWGGDC